MRGCRDLVNMVNVYHHLARFSSPTPSLQLSSVSDESLVLLYLSHSDEVELMATFTPADVIRVVRLGSRRGGRGPYTCWVLLRSSRKVFLKRLPSAQLACSHPRCVFALCFNSKTFNNLLKKIKNKNKNPVLEQGNKYALNIHWPIA